MAWLHNIEVKFEMVEALELYCRNTGASRREAMEYALSSLPTYHGTLELPGWAEKIQQSFIEQRQPFVLNYRDASDRFFQWTICYAEFATHEGNLYLDFWSQETQGNLDIEPLQHNWSVRLDRIISVETVPAIGEWLPKLDAIEVEFHLYGALSYNYAKESGNQKPDDILSDRLDANTRKVVRRVTSTFWFMREIFAYSDDCQVISPASVIRMILAKTQKLINRYTGIS